MQTQDPAVSLEVFANVTGPIMCALFGSQKLQDLGQILESAEYELLAVSWTDACKARPFDSLFKLEACICFIVFRPVPIFRCKVYVTDCHLHFETGLI